MTKQSPTSEDTHPIFEIEEFEVGGYAFADQAAVRDAIGFEPYVQAMATFLLSPQTTTPLTVSIEGEWGTGKSSFMRQLEEHLSDPAFLQSTAAATGEQIRSGRSIWFNAWRNDKQESLWAGFALLVAKGLRDHLGLWARVRGDLRLFRLRINGITGWISIVARTSFWWLAIILVAILVAELLGDRHHQIFRYLTHFPAPSQDRNTENTDDAWSWLQKLIAVTVTLAGLFEWWNKNVGNPLELKLRKLAKHPDYESQVPFVEGFHRDLKKLLNAYLGNERLFVFIDDIDRCSDENIYHLLQAINLAIGDEGPIIFILGMDRKRAASLLSRRPAVEYPPTRTADEKLDYGNAFLDKFIQVPFRVPTPSFRSMDGYVAVLTGGKHRYGPGTLGRLAPKGARIVKAKLGKDSPSVHELAMISAPYLGKSPRKVKQFINMFRLQAFIAASIGLLDVEEPNKAEVEAKSTNDSITIEQLGKFVALMLGWPRILDDLSKDPKLINRLALIAEEANPATLHPGPGWESDPLLLVLLKTCTEIDGQKFSLRKAPIDRLLEIWPKRIAEPLKPHVIRAGPNSEYVLGHGESEEEAWTDAANRLKRAGVPGAPS